MNFQILDMFPTPYGLQYFDNFDIFSTFPALKSIVGHEEGVDLLLMIDRISPLTKSSLISTAFFSSVAADMLTAKSLSILATSCDISKCHKHILTKRVSISKDFLGFIQLLSEKLVIAKP